MKEQCELWERDRRTGAVLWQETLPLDEHGDGCDCTECMIQRAERVNEQLREYMRWREGQGGQGQ